MIYRASALKGENMSVRLYVGFKELGLKVWNFPAGEVGVKVLEPHFLGYQGETVVECNFESNDDLFVVAQLADIISHWKQLSSVELKINYMPYSRQDRKTSSGEANAMKVVGKFINSLGFGLVTTSDPHSDVVEAVVDNLDIVEQWVEMVEFSGYLNPYTVLVSPDAGALKKIYKVANKLKYPVICATKVRDVETGDIVDTQVEYNLEAPNPDFLIVDDICDGGRTFIELAKKLKPLTQGRILLYITHGVFSKGFDDLEQHFDQIYVANNMRNLSNNILIDKVSF